MEKKMGRFSRRAALAAGAGALLAGYGTRGIAAGAPEKTSLQLGVGGKPLLYYLPLTVTERLGYFKDAGLDVRIADFGGGAKSLQALIGGSTDVGTGAYEHCIQMQAKRQAVVATCVLDRFPGIGMGILADRADRWQGPASLKGMKIGVTAPGSSTNFLASYMMVKAGLKPNDAAFIGIGSGPSAIAAARRGEIDVVVNTDPVISQLETMGAIKVVADTRTVDGTEAVYGGGSPGAVLYAKRDFIDANPNTMQALTGAFLKALAWMQKASDAEIADLMPQEYLLGDREAYLKALSRSREMYSPDGRLDMQAAGNAAKVLAEFDPLVGQAKIDLAATFDGRFIDAAHP